MENSLESAQHALQDKQQVCALFVPLAVVLYFVFLSFTSIVKHFGQELNKVQKKTEEQAQSLKEKREQCTQLETNVKEYKDKLLASEQRMEQLQSLNKV